jgi:hypothetical protein
MFPYRGDRWGWNDFDACLSKNLEVDWALIVKSFCVIDCDTEEAAADLLSRFPCLADAPCAQTIRGVHFYFLRSALADVDGYWDQVNQENKIDFKSMTKTGTGGIVVVPPSHGKTWIRPLWTTPLTEIPNDLLMSVSVPSTVPMKIFNEKLDDPTNTGITGGGKEKRLYPSKAAIMLEFENEDSMLIDGMQLDILNHSEYFRALLSGRWMNEVNEEAAIPSFKMPCERAVCEEIFSLFQKETLTPTRPPTRTLLAKIDVAMDMLGFAFPKNPLLMRHSFFVDLYNISPEWWGIHQSELTLMLGTSEKASDASLVTVDEDLANMIGYEALPKDSRWLFEELPLLLDAEQWKNNKVIVDHPSESVMSQLPHVVLEILRLHPSHIAVAGGAVLGGISRFSEEGNDIDMFVYGLDQNASSKLLHEVEELVFKTCQETYEKTSSVAAITFTKKKEKKKNNVLQDRPFQIVLGLHRARSQILEYFDLAPCKVLARIDALTGKLVVEALPSFVLSLKNMCFVVDIMYWSPASVTRITKYVAKGFECFVPGIKRGAFKREFTSLADHFQLIQGGTTYYGGKKEVTTDGPISYKHVQPKYSWKTELTVPEDVQGIGVLFVAESDFLRSRNFEFPECEWTEAISGRLQIVEAETIAAKCAGKLGTKSKSLSGSRTYYQRSTGTYGFIRESFRRHVAVRLGDHRRDIPIGTQFFAFTEAGRFKPADAHMDYLYDQEALDNIAQEEISMRAGNVNLCSFCSQPEVSEKKLKMCSRCKIMLYCSRDCQIKHWKTGHKEICKKKSTN